MGLKSAGVLYISHEPGDSNNYGEKAIENPLLTARRALCQTLEKTRQLESLLDKSQLRLRSIGERLPPLEKAITPLQLQSNLMKDLSRRVDKGMEPAKATLKIYEAVHKLERTIQRDPRHDLHGYLVAIIQLEELLEHLKRQSAVTVESLQEVIEFLETSKSVDNYRLHKLHEYLQTTLKAQQTGEETSGVDGGLLSIALEKLVAEFRRLVVQYTLPVILHEDVAVQTEEHTPHVKKRDNLPLLPTVVLEKIHAILDRLAANHWVESCVDVYKEVRSTQSLVTLQTLQSEYLKNWSSEAIDKLNWEDLQTMIGLWAQHIGVAVRVLYAYERRLAREVFSPMEPHLWVECFSKVAWTGMLQFVQFGEVVGHSQRAPEKLFKLLDMFEAMEACASDVAQVFEGEGCRELRKRVQELQKQIADGACQTFWEFENWVQVQNEDVPLYDGSVMRLCSYVVNYLKYLLSEFYYPIIDQVLKFDQSWDGESRNEEGGLSHGVLLFMQALERQVVDRSKEYPDAALRHIFLMNNIWYMCTRVKQTELGALLGDTWIADQRRKVKQHALGYETEGWRQVSLPLSSNELIASSGGRGVAHDLVRQRLGAFNTAFEDTLRRHSAWSIPEDDLRVDMQLVVVQTLVPTYRSFIQSYGSLIERGGSNIYIKYSAEKVEAMLGDLFRGRPVKPQRNGTNLHTPDGKGSI